MSDLQEVCEIHEMYLDEGHVKIKALWQVNFIVIINFHHI